MHAFCPDHPAAIPLVTFWKQGVETGRCPVCHQPIARINPRLDTEEWLDGCDPEHTDDLRPVIGMSQMGLQFPPAERIMCAWGLETIDRAVRAELVYRKWANDSERSYDEMMRQYKLADSLIAALACQYQVPCSEPNCYLDDAGHWRHNITRLADFFAPAAARA